MINNPDVKSPPSATSSKRHKSEINSVTPTRNNKQPNSSGHNEVNR